MDDFGSACSSLNVLKEFTFDELKLDMSFLRPFNLRSKRIVTAVVKMAKVIDIHTLAEGVETEEQFDYLRDIGFEKVQGYFFGKPMPYEDAIANLRDKGVEIEPPRNRRFYDDIGKIDYLSAVPFMKREKYNATSAPPDSSTVSRWRWRYSLQKTSGSCFTMRRLKRWCIAPVCSPTCIRRSCWASPSRSASSRAI